MSANTATKTRPARIACNGAGCKNKARKGEVTCGTCAAKATAAIDALTACSWFAGCTAQAMTGTLLCADHVIEAGRLADEKAHAEAFAAGPGNQEGPSEDDVPADLDVRNDEPETVGSVIAHAAQRGLAATLPGRVVTVKVEGQPVRLRYTRPAGHDAWQGVGTWTVESNGRQVHVEHGVWTLDGQPLDLRKTARLTDAVRAAL